VVDLLKVTDGELQGIFDAQTYRLGRSDSRAGAVGDLRLDGERVRGSVRGNRPRPFELWVRREGSQILSQCNCPEWAGARRHCRHVAAVLYSLLWSDGEAAPAAQTDSAERRPALSSWFPEEQARTALPLTYLLSIEGDGLRVRRLRGDREEDPESVDAARMASEDQRVAEVVRTLSTPGDNGARRVALRRAGDLLAAMRGRRSFLDDRQQIPLSFSTEPLTLRVIGSPPQPNAVEPYLFRPLLVTRDGEQTLSLRKVVLLGGVERFVLAADVAYPLDARLSLAALERLRGSEWVECRAEELPRAFKDWFPRLADETGALVPSPEELMPVIGGDPTLLLACKGEIDHAEVQLLARYGQNGEAIPLGDDSEAIPALDIRLDSLGKPYALRRDPDAELAALDLLSQMGLHREAGLFSATGMDALAFWSDGLGKLPASWDRQLPEAMAGLRVRRQSVTAQLSLRRTASGWFAVDLKLLSEGVEADPEAFIARLQEGFVTLMDGSVAPVEPGAMDALAQAWVELKPELRNGEIPPWLAGPLSDLIKLAEETPQADLRLDPQALETLRSLGQGTGLPEEPMPGGLLAEPRPYQVEGYRWLHLLWRNGRGALGALLADEMGLGKTLQTLAFIARRRELGVKSPALVVTPTSVIPNWVREVERFLPSLTAESYSGIGRTLDRPCDLLVTSYALMRRDIAQLRDRDWSTVVLDEAQNVKNPQSATAQAACELRADFRVALTGTPLENRPLDLWSIFRFLSPDLLSSQADFQRRYESPSGTEAEQAHRRLASRVRPFLKRRLKRDVLSELPDKQEAEMVCEMSGPQRELYLSVLAQVRSEIFRAIESKGVEHAQLNVLAGLLRLRQVACDPRLVGRDSERYGDDDSAKLLLFQELLEEALEGGHRVICFSQFVQMLKLMRRLLERLEIPYAYLDGRSQDRQAIIDRFNAADESSPKVFLISLRAGGTGLNLATADTVFLYDPWWNPAVEDQAIDRVHRIGQTKDVNVYRLIARGTVEEKILDLKQRKREVTGRVLAGEAAGGALTAADVEELLRVG
jgi:superfamily II DNA or RNA helicase